LYNKYNSSAAWHAVLLEPLPPPQAQIEKNVCPKKLID